MSTEFWVQMVIYAVTIGSFAGTVLTRIKNLEKKMDKHNNLVERVTKCEADGEYQDRRIARLEAK